MEQLTPTQIKAKAIEYFTLFPRLDLIFITGDGTAFSDKNNAKIHSKNNRFDIELNITAVFRSSDKMPDCKFMFISELGETVLVSRSEFLRELKLQVLPPDEFKHSLDLCDCNFTKKC